MLRHYLVTTLRNLARNRLYAAICIGGLAIGMAAALLTALYIHDEVGFDASIPGYRDAYVLISDFRLGGRPPLVTDTTPVAAAPALKLEFKDIQVIARLDQQTNGVRRGDRAAAEVVGWVDPDFFSILPLPLVAGDAVAAMHRPDSVVITRAMARKYFGQDAPIGQTLELDGTTVLRVGAVLKDIPANSNLAQQIYVSNLNAASGVRAVEARPIPRGGYSLSERTYMRLTGPAAAARINAGMPAFFARYFALPDGKLNGGATASLRVIPLADLHLYPINGTLGTATPQGSTAVLVALALVAVLILAVAGINFVNLMTARASRRAIEVGVRKAAGARRPDLVLQFMGEAVVYALIALVLALAGVELVLPGMRVLLDRPLDFAYWHEPGLVLGLLLLAVVTGALAGVYPAFVQSSYRPAAVLKGVLPQTSGSMAVRAVLTSLQFACLIGLVLAAIVITLQTRYALNEGLNVDKAQMVMMDISSPRRRGVPPPVPPLPRCRDAFPDEVRGLPGVKGVACTNRSALDIGDSRLSVLLPSGAAEGLGIAYVDEGFFELYGLKPLAGRFFSRAHPGDETLLQGPPPWPPKAAVISEKAARTLGFASPAAAIGHSFKSTSFGPSPVTIGIVGVVPNFAFDLIDHGQRPMVYIINTATLDTLNIKLTGDHVAQTLQAIDGLWRQTGVPRPPTRRLVDQYLQTIYVGSIREGYLLDALCGVAVFLACLGLFGLASFTAERRTKEIGVRKTMGASRTSVIGMLLWSFTRPVLWANLIAWPVAWWALNGWLQGFARHIQLDPALFLAASLAALTMAWATVLLHTVKIASAKPVGALRYE